MLDTCTLAVFGLMNRVSAIWGLDRPAASSTRISRSRSVSPNLASGSSGTGRTVSAAGSSRFSRFRRASAAASCAMGAAPTRLARAWAWRTLRPASSRSPAAAAASARRSRVYASG